MEYKDLYASVASSNGLCSDSRRIKPGECFFALQGLSTNGQIFAQEALANGAKLVVSSSKGDNQGFYYVSDVKKALAYCAKRFYDQLPAHKLAITGTNGKTSTADFCRQIFELLGQKSASIGTLGVVSNAEISSEVGGLASLTSNDLLSNYKILSQLKAADVDCVAMEASSIGIEQGRLDGIAFEAAAFTTFSLDHLDYHPDMQSYLRAKLKLFTQNLAPGALVFVAKEVVDKIAQNSLLHLLPKYLCIGEDDSCDVQVISHQSTLNGQRAVFCYEDKKYELKTKVVGGFQMQNLIFAVMLCHAAGFPLQEVVAVADKVQAVKGRLQRSRHENKYVFIDYAHNPDALEKILLELNVLKKPHSKIITIFGCGGDRDKSKRPLMGEIASRLSGFVIITDDNPRREDPATIHQQIANGIKSNNYKIIENRKKAIVDGLNMMKNCDIMLITGKGHEEYQIYDNKKQPFSDLDVANQNIY